jgi:mannose-1-phosphate guanylyltransferase
VWTVVLAGGDGERLRPLTERWLGRHVPKQYCTFVGTRSMLEHTLDRALQLSVPERVVTVVARSHAGLGIRPHPALTGGTVVMQPENRDTAPGVFLALSCVRAADPEASVVILPSDHFVHPEDVFVTQIRDALDISMTCSRLVVLGVKPHGLELEYGWIQPGDPVAGDGHRRVHAVEAFVEKPTAAVAERIRGRGALWNTMVAASSLRRLWDLGRRHVPDIVRAFHRFTAFIGTRQEPEVLNDMYRTMPRRNFSADFLQHLGDELAVAEVNGVTWSDWGSAERIVETIRRLGKRPAFAKLDQRCQPGRGTAGAA